MKAPRHLYRKDLSRCCGARALLVLSRPGGFVTCGCMECGKPDYVRLEQLPDLLCEACGDALAAQKLDGAYRYNCPTCGGSWSLPENLPQWNDVFARWGIAAHGDFAAQP